MFTYLELLADCCRLRSPEESGDFIEETAEEGTEVAFEAEEEAPHSEPEENVLDLAGIPEEYHERIKQRDTLLRGQTESGWTKKFQEQAERLKALEEYEQTVRGFNENFEKDPQGVIEYLRNKAPTAPVKPEHPGEPPDVIEDPDGFNKWMIKRDEYLAHQIEEKVRSRYGDLAQTQTVLQQIQRERAMAETRAAIGASEDEFSEVLKIRDELAGDPNKAFKFILDTLKLKNGTQQHVREAIRGTEERPGLQRSGARRKVPAPTGDHMTDALAELEASGVEFPEELL